MSSAKYLILIYGSEVSSIYDKDDYDSCEKDIIEKDKSIFRHKQVLGDNNQCSNAAWRNDELGRLALKEINILMLLKVLDTLRKPTRRLYCKTMSTNIKKPG